MYKIVSIFKTHKLNLKLVLNLCLKRYTGT